MNTRLTLSALEKMALVVAASILAHSSSDIIVARQFREEEPKAPH